MRRFFLFFSVLILFASAYQINPTTKKIKKGAKPLWLKKVVAPEGFYVGIGSGKSIESSYNSSLSIISSQIKARLVSNIETSKDIKAFDKKVVLFEELKRDIILNSKLEIEDVEVIEIWFDSKNKEYFTYTRLDIKKYQEREKNKREIAKNTSFDLFKKAEVEGNPSLAIKYYFLALFRLSPYFDSQMLVYYNGNNIDLVNEITTKIFSFLNNIEINSNQKEIEIDRFLKNDFLINFKFTFNKKPLSNMPILFYSSDNALLLNEQGITDSNGIVNCIIKKVLSHKGIATINATVDLKALFQNELSDELLIKIFSTSMMFVVKKEINVRIKEPIFLFKAVEIKGDLEKSEFKNVIQNFGSSLKSLLTQKGGITFSDKDGDFILNVVIDGSLSFSELSGFYFARVTVVVIIIDKKTGNQVYSYKSSEIKSGNTSYLKAIQSALLEFEKNEQSNMVDKILEFLA